MFKFPFFRKGRRVTLVLGGGSARGIAHVGILKVFDREKIPIHRIIGTSIGSLVGAAYALGIPVERIEEKALKFSWKKIFDPTVPKMGLLAGEKLEAVIRDITEGLGFQDCKIPLCIVTTDIENGEGVVLEGGDLCKAIRASSSWPGIFAPVTIDGRLLVDGGVKNSVPTKIARSYNPDYVIAVDVGFCVRRGKIENIFQMILQSFQIMGDELNKYQAATADAMIRVELGDMDQAAFDRTRFAIENGVAAAEGSVAQIKKDLGILRRRMGCPKATRIAKG